MTGFLDTNVGCSTMTPNCAECGRFFKMEPGVAWKMVYSGGPIPMPDREIYRCKRCAEALGPFSPQYGIKPEYSVGVVEGVEPEPRRRWPHGDHPPLFDRTKVKTPPPRLPWDPLGFENAGKKPPR